MKKIISLFFVAFAIIVQANAQIVIEPETEIDDNIPPGKEIVDLPKPPSLPKDTIIKPGDISPTSYTCKDYNHWPEITTPKWLQEVELGKTFVIRWDSYVYGEDFWGNDKYAHNYNIIITWNGLQEVNIIQEGDHDGDGNAYWYTPDCSKPGAYGIKIIPLNKDNLPYPCVMARVVLTTMPLVQPAPQLHMVCDPGTYRAHVANPQKADKLLLYKDIGGLPDKTITDKDGNGDFYFDVPVPDAALFAEYYAMTFYRNFSSSNCGLTKESLPSPFGLVYFSVPLEKITGKDTVIISDDIPGCEDPSVKATGSPQVKVGNMYPLPSSIPVIDAQLATALDNLPTTADTFLKFTQPRVTAKWQFEQFTTPNYLGGDTVGQKVCNNNLPNFPGTCRFYWLSVDVTVHVELWDGKGHMITNMENTCSKGQLQKVWVCKEMDAPQSIIKVSCNTIPYIEVSSKGYADAYWYNRDGDLIATGFKNYNPSPYNSNNTQKGFSYGDFNKSNEPDNKLNYTGSVQYKAINGRLGPKGYYQVIPLPTPNQAAPTIYSDPDIPTAYLNRPTNSDPEDPNYCNEVKCFQDLDYNADEYINRVNGYLNSLPQLNNLLQIHVPSPVLDWQPGEYIRTFDPTPNDTIIDTIKRVCYEHLPNEADTNGNYCRTYFGRVHIKGDAMLVKSNPLTGKKDTLATADIDCDPTVWRWPICKATDIQPGDQCITEAAPKNYQWDNNVSDCDYLKFIYACPGETYTMKDEQPPVNIQGVYYEYDWNNTNGFTAGNDHSSSAEVTWNSLPQLQGNWETYKQTVTVKLGNTEVRKYKNCFMVFKCTTCPVEGRSAKPEAESLGKSIAGELSVYPNPAKSTLSVAYSYNEETYGNAEVQITDLMGRTVKHVPLAGNKSTVTVSVEDLPEGSYVCLLVSGNARLSAKLFQIVNR